MRMLDYRSVSANYGWAKLPGGVHLAGPVSLESEWNMATTKKKAGVHNGWMHMAVSKKYLLQFLRSHPEEWQEVVSGAKSLEDAVQFISDGPEWHPLGKCEGFDYEMGKCPGHEGKP